jgi:hypothetical protein
MIQLGWEEAVCRSQSTRAQEHKKTFLLSQICALDTAGATHNHYCKLQLLRFLALDPCGCTLFSLFDAGTGDRWKFPSRQPCVFFFPPCVHQALCNAEDAESQRTNRRSRRFTACKLDGRNPGFERLILHAATPPPPKSTRREQLVRGS